MPNYIKIGRDIIVGKGFKAKHWAGPVVFGSDAIYICPNASRAAVVAGLDSGAVGLGLFGAVGGAIAGLAKKGSDAPATWKNYIVDLPDLPAETLSDPDWPIRRKKRPVIVLRRDQIEKIERAGSKLLVSTSGETFKLGLKFFGRAKIITSLRGLGWSL
jgi:hypothetical protein